MSSLPADLEKCTLALWQPRTRRVLQEAEVRLMIDNVRGFMGVLQDWQANMEKEDASTTN
jgi:hypothetical protein